MLTQVGRFAWSGNKGSVLGQTSLYGKLLVSPFSLIMLHLTRTMRSGIEFWTQHKVRFLVPRLARRTEC